MKLKKNTETEEEKSYDWIFFYKEKEIHRIKGDEPLERKSPNNSGDEK